MGLMISIKNKSIKNLPTGGFFSYLKIYLLKEGKTKNLALVNIGSYAIAKLILMILY